MPSQTGGLRPLASVETKLPGKHELFGALEDGEKYVPSQAMSEGDMEGAIGEFVAAARGAVEAGSEGVEIHGMLSRSSWCFHSVLPGLLERSGEIPSLS